MLEFRELSLLTAQTCTLTLHVWDVFNKYQKAPELQDIVTLSLLVVFYFILVKCTFVHLYFCYLISVIMSLRRRRRLFHSSTTLTITYRKRHSGKYLKPSSHQNVHCTGETADQCPASTNSVRMMQNN